MKKIIVIGIFILTITLFSLLLVEKNSELEVTNFEDCSQKYPVMESYPASCITPDGKRFTQNIGNELALSDSIQITSPRPNQVVTKSFVIQGSARGFWFFEGQMNAELRDLQNNLLGKTTLTADANWMSEEFVPYSGLLEFKNDVKAKNGLLIVQSSNPSGLLQNSKELIVPVVFR